MTSDIQAEAPVKILTGRQRSRAITLPEDLSEEELARDWTLSETDKVQVRRCRGEANRRRFALQLCALRRYGRLVDDYHTVPVRILNHLSRQLDLPPILALDPPERAATETEQQQRIREYLGYRSFDEGARTDLEDHLRAQVAQGLLPSELFQSAENILRFWKTVLPAPATLERLVASVAASGREEILERIAMRLTPPLREAIDRALEVPAEEAQSALFQLKEYPPEASPASIRAFIDRLALLRSMGVSDIDLNGFSSHLLNHLAQLARKYDVQALKRFVPSGRYAMVACLLVDAHKTILDHVVTMHDQFLTGLCRRSRHAFEERQREFRRRAKQGVDTLLEAMDILLDPRLAGTNPLLTLYRRIDPAVLR